MLGHRKPCRFDPWVWKIPGEGNGNPLRWVAWEIPRAEEPGGLQSTGSKKSRAQLSEWAPMHRNPSISIWCLDFFTSLRSWNMYKVACLGNRKTNEETECGLWMGRTWLLEALYDTMRRLTFMLNVMGRHWRILRKGVPWCNSHVSQPTPTLSPR